MKKYILASLLALALLLAAAIPSGACWMPPEPFSVLSEDGKRVFEFTPVSDNETTHYSIITLRGNGDELWRIGDFHHLAFESSFLFSDCFAYFAFFYPDTGTYALEFYANGELTRRYRVDELILEDSDMWDVQYSIGYQWEDWESRSFDASTYLLQVNTVDDIGYEFDIRTGEIVRPENPDETAVNRMQINVDDWPLPVPFAMISEDEKQVFHFNPGNAHEGSPATGLYHNTEPLEAIYLVENMRDVVYQSSIMFTQNMQYFVLFVPRPQENALEFYGNGRLLKEYKAEDLVKHFEMDRSTTMVHWLSHRMDIALDHEANTLTLMTVDGQVHVFDMITGAMVGMKADTLWIVFAALGGAVVIAAVAVIFILRRRRRLYAKEESQP